MRGSMGEDSLNDHLSVLWKVIHHEDTENTEF